MHNPQPNTAFGPVINRLGDLMMHSTRYSVHGSTRLAFDAGTSVATVSRFIRGKQNPTHALMSKLADALEKDFGFRIDPRDIASLWGQFPTRFCCDVVGCRGCLPDRAYDADGNRLKSWEEVKPGAWITSRYPKGYAQKGDL